MKETIAVLLAYLTCDDPVVQNKYENILNSFWHRDNGHIISQYIVGGNGDVTFTITDGNGVSEDVVISQFVMPGSMPMTFISGLVDALNNKVDTTVGKQLSTEDFTTDLLNKLNALELYIHPAFHEISEINGLQTLLDSLQSQVDNKLPLASYTGNAQTLKDDIDAVTTLEPVKNLINPSEIDYINRYSTSTNGFIADTLGIAASGFIPVQEGLYYTLWGDGAYTGWQGGYFANQGDAVSIDDITFINPAAGSGRIFQVPTGQGINYVVVSLRKLNSDETETQLHGTVQLEKNHESTSYEPYQQALLIKESLLPKSTINTELWYNFTEGEEKTDILNAKAPVFRDHYLKKDKDLVVVNTGTSLTARTTEHCTSHLQADQRPPLMHSNNLASILWDKMKWDNQFYRRYDYPGFFTETGSFNTDHDLAQWDDGSYRNGLTRYSDSANAQVDFQIPVDAWQFNFIYRTDITATENAQLTITEGNGNVEVWNGAAWLEANGYIFSMREAAPVSRNIDVPRASDGVMQTQNIPSKGNTIYQKRLKMRCKSGAIDSRNIVKNVSIEATTTGRFNYWGTEWSLREFMLTYINAARGSHNTQADGVNGLPKFQDNEVWDFQPDLLFFELPIHNDGAADEGATNPGQFERLTDHFVFRADYELSLTTRGAFFGLSPEIIMFTSSIAWNFGGINDDGSLKLGEQLDGAMRSALDKYNEAYNWVLENYPQVGIINSVQRWVDAGFSIFGDLRTATEGSGKNGQTFTNEGSHWNDTGSKIIAKTLTGVFENV